MKLFNMPIMATILSLLAIAISSFTFFKMETHPSCFNTPQKEEVLTKLLLDRARASVSNSQDITQKEEILSLLDSLGDNCHISEFGSDQLRVKFVHAQASIEHVLACALVLGDIKNLIGVIHTPNPATPLCTKVENLDDQLLDPSIRYDLEKLLTIQSRAIIVRQYLEQGGKLYIAYPKGGLEKRTQEQQDIYCTELTKYADRLFDSVLSCSEMDPQYVGATYFFKDQDDIYAFSIKASQAILPMANSEWGMWIGKIFDQNISKRVNEILDYLEANNGPNIRQELMLL